MQEATGISRRGRVYLKAVIVAGLSIILVSLFELSRTPLPWPWFALAGLTIISGSATVGLPSSYASISISEVFVLIAILLYGPAAGTAIVALDGLVISFWLARRYQEPLRALFNISAPSLSAWCAAHVFFGISRLSPLASQPAVLNDILPAMALSALTYFLLNTWLITLAIAAERHVNAFTLWTSQFIWLSLNYFCGASIAVLVVTYTRAVDIAFVGVIVPLLLVIYFTFRATIGRVEDAQKHVDELNGLYMSSIETLAMAIDAKDQVTHGHIRRVQTCAVALAHRLGVNDADQLKAIQAAALLHDMGKLAVPEYILNKPGKLTAAEFEQMKLHASVGADILSAIRFPYPVVPIVRHHHENWDGTGYPDGLASTAIPIGARILAVVDCFDALTSDRPYRPRLSHEDALAILRQRRGSMYDPIVVDTFINVHQDIAPDLSPNTPSLAVGSASNAPLPSKQSVDTLPEHARLMAVLDFVLALAHCNTPSEVFDSLSGHIAVLIRSSLWVLFAYDASEDGLVVRYSSGDGATRINGLRISRGERLSGWVAANRRTIANSDPYLDLGELATIGSGRLRSCLSAPLICENALVGVLSLYALDERAYSEQDQQLIEAIARHLGRALGRVAGSFDTLPSPALTI